MSNEEVDDDYEIEVDDNEVFKTPTNKVDTSHDNFQDAWN